MFIIGLTGGIATGKSTVLSIFKEHNIAVINADEIAKQIIQPGTKGWKEVIDYFGPTVVHQDGRINRTALSEFIFNDVQKRRKLNSITHPKIQRTMISMAFKYFISGHKYIVMELPLLFETGKMLSFMHKIITVVCEDNEQLHRLCLRNDINEEVAKKRIFSQMPLEEKVAKSHFVINNSGHLNFTRQQTESIIRLLNKSTYTRYFRVTLAVVVVVLIYICVYIYITLILNNT